MSEAESFKVVLQMQRRKDGGLRVWSKDVPGLVLSHRDPQKVIEDIKPALEMILSAVFGCEVAAHRLGKLPKCVTEAPQTPAPAPRRPRPVRAERPVYDVRKTLEYAAHPCG